MKDSTNIPESKTTADTAPVKAVHIRFYERDENDKLHKNKLAVIERLRKTDVEHDGILNQLQKEGYAGFVVDSDAVTNVKFYKNMDMSDDPFIHTGTKNMFRFVQKAAEIFKPLNRGGLER